MIVEDMQQDADMVVAQLQSAGFDPAWNRVETEPDFLAEIKKRPDIILSDYSMPQFTGLRAVELLKKSGLDIPFILISGTVGEEIAVEAMRRGATDYLLKDRIARLGVAVEQALEKKRLRDERKRVQESLNLFRTLIDRSSDGINVIDPDTGRFLDVNEATCEQLGYSREEMLAMSVPDIEATGSLKSTWLRNLEEMQKAGFRITESLHRRKDGSTFPVEVNVRYIRLDRSYLVAVVRDITGRKQAEEVLRESEERFRQLAENIDEVFWLTNPVKSEMLYISPAYEKIWGRRCEDLCASPHTWLDAIHPEDCERIRHAATKKQEEGTYDEEYRIIQPDGSIRWIRDRAFPVRNASGEIQRIAGVARDITEGRQATERIQEQAALLDKAHDAILVRDLEGRILFWNKGAERIYGWTREEAMASHISGIIRKNEEAYNAVLKDGEWSGELQKASKDGRKLIVESRWTLLRDRKGSPKSIFVIATDITERKKIEAQFLRAQRMESIGTLAGGVAHDLNNILAPIMMSIEILKDASRDPQSQNILNTLEVSAQRGADIVRQILSFARGMDGNRIEVQPKHLLKDIEDIIRSTFPKNIQWELSVPYDTWTVLGDPTQLHQILLNLCVNARDAMPDGGLLRINVESRMLDGECAAMHLQAKPGPSVIISVQDTGTGMTPEVMDKIFDPFFTTKEIGHGTGLGLSTVMAIVTSHEAGINVCSEPGKGTTFRLYLPAVNSCESGSGPKAEVSLPRGNRETVLLIDDEASILTITSQTLEAFGYQVLTASNGAAAVAIYAQRQDEIAVVITDMMMPLMDGRATVYAMKEINPVVKIIAASGLNSKADVSTASDAGAKNFLSKPYSAETLLKTLRAVLDNA
ncbi:MAG: PAS domain S-box protein [Chthoniobacteraceae bacterium]